MIQFNSLYGFCRFYVLRQARAILRHYSKLSNPALASHRGKFAIFRHLIDQLREHAGDQSSPFSAFHSYCQVDAVVRQFGRQSRSVLELGPGSNLGALFCFAASGVERAAGVDIQPIERHPEFYCMMKDYLACVAAFQWWRPNGPCAWEDVDAQALLNRVEYFAPVAAHELPFGEEEFDLVYSRVAMEHFDRPREAVQQIQRVLSPGGLTVHLIDLSSHGFGDGHFDQFRLNEEEYQRLTKKYGGGLGIDQIIQEQWKGAVYCNRLLASDWQQLFLDAGMDVLSVDVLGKRDSAAINPASLAAPFCHRSREELAPEIIRLVAQKPKQRKNENKVGQEEQQQRTRTRQT